MKKILSTVVLFVCVATAVAQGSGSTNSAAVKYFKKAQKALQSKDLQLSLN